MRRPLLASGIVSLAVAACSGEAPLPGAEPTGRTESSIVNGKASDATQDAIVLIVYPLGNGSFECSGALLAPNLVVTARHCVSDTTEAPFTCDEKGVGTAGGDTRSDYTASNMFIVTGVKRPVDPTRNGSFAARGKQIIHDGAKNLCNHDIALIVLDRAIPDAKILPVRVETPAKAGEAVTAIGWGVTTTTPEPLTRQQRAGVPVASVGAAIDSASGQPVPDREFIVGESICQGDSGGPAVSETTGAILGVASRGGNGSALDPSKPSAVCTNGVINWYSMAAGYKDLLTQGYAAAGQDPWWEGQPDPRLAKFGEACTGNDACRSSMCLADSKGTFTTCTQSCAKDNPCPAATVCKIDSAGAGICKPPDPVATTTTTKSCGCGIANLRAPATAAWALGLGLGVLFLRRRRATR